MSEHIPHHARVSARLKFFGLAALGGLIAIAAEGIWLRVNHEHDLKKEVEAQHITVQIVHPQYGSSQQPLVLPGDVKADFDAPIYARVNGYLKAWYTDIGTHVKKGQVLAEIETPELDQQILRARADLASAQSNWEIADITAKRWENLLVTDSVSHQEADERASTAKAKNDALISARATLQGLLAQQAFNKIVAPFDGVVTERNTDIGKLINTGSSSGQALFRVVDMSKLRVYVEVPQNFTYLVKPGMQVYVDFPERPLQHFSATVMNTSNAIHETSRTSTVELRMENKDGAIFPGSYAEVHFDLTSDSSVFRLPVSALLFRKDGLEVATVDANNHVFLKHIVVARDLGREVEVASGLNVDDRIIDSPSDSIVQGDVVRIKAQGAQAVQLKSGGKP